MYCYFSVVSQLGGKKGSTPNLASPYIIQHCQLCQDEKQAYFQQMKVTSMAQQAAGYYWGTPPSYFSTSFSFSQYL